MAKKKATMTLKDFHGGSIPSDLPLPSAPGVVRPLDRNGFDRQTPWGSTAGRTDHKLRPGSAGASRNFDEKTPFLNHNAHIGRNFDEDERKPLDGVSVPRRMVSDESLRAQPSRVEPRKDNLSDGRARSRPVTAPVSQISSGTASGSYASRFAEANNNAGVNTQTFGGNSRVNVTSSNVGGQAVIGSYSNAWGLKKEATRVKEPVATGWSALDTATKLAHASALEKVSSGRWHSKQQMNFPTEVEVLKHQETKRESYYRGGESYDRNAYSVSDAVDGMDYNNKSLALGDGIHVASNKELPAHERVHSPVFMEGLEKRASATINGVQRSQYAVKHGESEPQSPVPSEALERPKLKLLPRSKPLENYEQPTEYKQGHQQQSDPVRLEYGATVPESCNPHKHGFVGYEGGDRAVDRPKLNLKPRSQPLEHDEKGKRNTVFGGARPRELVLKARGVDDAGTNDHDRQHFSRNKQDASRTETGQVHATRYNGRAENIVTDNRTTGNTDRRDPRFNGQRSDMQRRNRQSENPRNGRDREIERYHHQQPQAPQDRPTSPETWRKPVEHPKPSSDVPVVRYGKVASAIELATAFSKSVSDPPSADCFSGPRNLTTNRNQAPFSRLMGPPTRPQAQINSY
ncbi:PREDICTED: uncharacterized protein LOC109170350 isoform X2 [Ipomoea nil]|uniref:uncharacterized protein LOC109170350 isoform X2 n=1 Tax=Ipomoea nil TaxID=35883 RepID=UPI000902002D|nr:PREDICTED: uncharacterized protein LOC109170350 isoform X2 [Ipomoea nil]